METNTLYDELELPKNCTSDEIKQKYRILAQMHHPDKGGDPQRFKRIKVAYEILGDPEKRAHYDSTGEHPDEVSIDTEVFNRISVMVNQYIHQINPEHDDLILVMKIDIRQAYDNTTNVIAEYNTLIHKLNVISNKIKLKKEGENLLKFFVEKRITQCQTELIHCQKLLLVFNKMLEVLEGYHYSQDEWMLLLQNAENQS
jgi:curved DNA-binding protein CbpA